MSTHIHTKKNNKRNFTVGIFLYDGKISVSILFCFFALKSYLWSKFFYDIKFCMNSTLNLFVKGIFINKPLGLSKI